MKSCASPSSGAHPSWWITAFCTCVPNGWASTTCTPRPSPLRFRSLSTTGSACGLYLPAPANRPAGRRRCSSAPASWAWGIYRRRQTDRPAGGAVHRLQHRGPGDQPGLHVAVCGKIRLALHAGEDRGYFHCDVLELCDETQSGAGIDYLYKGNSMVLL